MIKIALYLLSGAVLGWLQFRGLWETVRRLATMRRPARWMIASLFVRIATSVLGLWLLARHGGVLALLAALAGMLLVRIALQRHYGTRDDPMQSRGLP